MGLRSGNFGHQRGEHHLQSTYTGFLARFVFAVNGSAKRGLGHSGGSHDCSQSFGRLSEDIDDDNDGNAVDEPQVPGDSLIFIRPPSPDKSAKKTTPASPQQDTIEHNGLHAHQNSVKF